MKTRIHVNQHNIKHNAKHENRKPVITVKDYKQNRLGNEALIIKDGDTVCKIVYSPDKPLSCGAKVWVETEEEVVVL